MKYIYKKLLESEGIRCPVAPTPWSPKPSVPVLTGGVIGLIVAASVIVISLVVGVIVVKIRKKYYLLQRTVSLEELTEVVEDF